MPQTKQDHKAFLNVVRSLKQRKARRLGAVEVMPDEFKIIVSEAKWMEQWLEGRSAASAQKTKHKGAKRKPLSEIKPESLKRRRARDAQKREQSKP